MDAFELLDVPRSLSLAPDDLRAAFREAGKRLHPDAGGSEAEFAKLQQAFGILSSPSRRLKHWLQLNGATGEDRGTISTALMDLFGRIGATVQQADELIRKRAETRSVLALAMLEVPTQACREAIEQGIAAVDSSIATETASFPSIESGAASPEQAFQHVRNLAFLEKWRASLQERFARLV